MSFSRNQLKAIRTSIIRNNDVYCPLTSRYYTGCRGSKRRKTDSILDDAKSHGNLKILPTPGVQQEEVNVLDALVDAGHSGVSRALITVRIVSIA